MIPEKAQSSFFRVDCYQGCWLCSTEAVCIRLPQPIGSLSLSGAAASWLVTNLKSESSAFMVGTKTIHRISLLLVVHAHAYQERVYLPKFWTV